MGKYITGGSNSESKYLHQAPGTPAARTEVDAYLTQEDGQREPHLLATTQEVALPFFLYAVTHVWFNRSSGGHLMVPAQGLYVGPSEYAGSNIQYRASFPNEYQSNATGYLGTADLSVFTADINGANGLPLSQIPTNEYLKLGIQSSGSVRKLVKDPTGVHYATGSSGIYVFYVESFQTASGRPDLFVQFPKPISVSCKNQSFARAATTRLGLATTALIDKQRSAQRPGNSLLSRIRNAFSS